MALAFTTLMSCSDDNEVDLSNRKFVRIDQSAVYVEIDENVTVTASVDTLAGDSYLLKWSVLDSDVATIEGVEKQRSRHYAYCRWKNGYQGRDSRWQVVLL